MEVYRSLIQILEGNQNNNNNNEDEKGISESEDDESKCNDGKKRQRNEKNGTGKQKKQKTFLIDGKEQLFKNELTQFVCWNGTHVIGLIIRDPKTQKATRAKLFAHRTLAPQSLSNYFTNLLPAILLAPSPKIFFASLPSTNLSIASHALSAILTPKFSSNPLRLINTLNPSLIRHLVTTRLQHLHIISSQTNKLENENEDYYSIASSLLPTPFHYTSKDPRDYKDQPNAIYNSYFTLSLNDLTIQGDKDLILEEGDPESAVFCRDDTGSDLRVVHLSSKRYWAMEKGSDKSNKRLRLTTKLSKSLKIKMFELRGDHDF